MKLLVPIMILILSVLPSRANTDHWYFQGEMGNCVPVEVFIETNSDYGELVGGYIYYPQDQSSNPKLLVGSVKQGMFSIQEYQSDGTITGRFKFRLRRELEGKTLSVAITEGEWTSVSAVVTLTLERMGRSMPGGMTVTRARFQSKIFRSSCFKDGTAQVDFFVKDFTTINAVPIRWFMRVEDGEWRVADIIFVKDAYLDLLKDMKIYVEEGGNNEVD